MAVMKRRSHMIPPQPMMKEVVEDEVASMKQGIVTILRTDLKAPADDKSPPPIRRTLSADMSSKTWLAQNGLLTTQPTVKSNPCQDDVWRSTIQSQKDVVKESRRRNPIWGSILITDHRKGDGCNDDSKSPPPPPPPPYVPRLTKRSSSTMSEKSLELCTESLGSETGSDSFLSSSSSSYHFSEYYSSYHADDCRAREKDQFKDDYNSCESLRVVKYKSAAPVRPFPPPIPSIISDGDSLRLQSRRENGRLVMEAVSAPPKNYLHARRGDGRLVLTLIRHQKAASADRLLEESKTTKGGIKEEGDKKEAVDQEVRSQLLSPNGTIRVHKSSQAMNSLTSPASSNHPITSISTPLDDDDPPPCTAAASPFIAYEHFWRNKTTTMASKRGGFVNPVIDGAKSMTSLKSYNTNDDNIYAAKQYMNRDLSVVATATARGGKLESFVPYLKGCKERKRSLLIWEPYCIATS